MGQSENRPVNGQVLAVVGLDHPVLGLELPVIGHALAAVIGLLLAMGLIGLAESTLLMKFYGEFPEELGIRFIVFPSISACFIRSSQDFLFGLKEVDKGT